MSGLTDKKDACSFALGRSEYCKGDTRFPATHSTLCPGYALPECSCAMTGGRVMAPGPNGAAS